MGFPEIHADTKLTDHSEIMQSEIDCLRSIISDQKKLISMLKTENARYREALERIANYGCGDGFNEFMSAIISAQEALKE